jgi:hypothetical protein
MKQAHPARGGGELGLGEFQVARIDVAADEKAGGAEQPGNRPSVPGAAERAIDDRLAGLGERYSRVSRSRTGS